MKIEPGLEAEVERTVTRPDLASALGSGDVDVLGTPTVVALCEMAAVEALRPALGPQETSVGVRIDLEHLAPTLAGATIVARARLVEVTKRTLRFEVQASDEAGEIARGTHLRVVVDRERFLESARARA